MGLQVMYLQYVRMCVVNYIALLFDQGIESEVLRGSVWTTRAGRRGSIVSKLFVVVVVELSLDLIYLMELGEPC